MKKITFLITTLAFVSAIGFSFVADNQKSDCTIFSADKYSECIKACKECIVACNACNDAMMKGKGMKMAKCIQLNKECVAICNVSIDFMTMKSEKSKDICLLCAKICEQCAVECEKYDMKEAIACASSCRNTAKLCNKMK